MDVKKVNENTFKAVLGDMKKFSSYSIQYGIFNNERAEKLKRHTYGSPARHLPKRDIMRPPLIKYRKKIAQQYRFLLLNTNVRQKHALYPVYNALGRFIIDNIIKNYLENNGEGELTPLSEKTIEKKGHNKILRDTYKMFNALNSRVKEK